MSRSRRFEQRVDIERSALQIVNTSEIALEERLAGLTAAAITSWSGRIKNSQNESQVARIHEILVAIATETGLLSDNSRAVFSTNAGHDNKNVEELIVTLKLHCN